MGCSNTTSTLSKSVTSQKLAVKSMTHPEHDSHMTRLSFFLFFFYNQNDFLYWMKSPFRHQYTGYLFTFRCSPLQRQTKKEPSRPPQENRSAFRTWKWVGCLSPGQCIYFSNYVNIDAEQRCVKMNSPFPQPLAFQMNYIRKCFLGFHDHSGTASVRSSFLCLFHVWKEEGNQSNFLHSGCSGLRLSWATRTDSAS